jgi:hypothetical protein
MKKFAIIYQNQIVYKYEDLEMQLFGGPWGSAEATQVELPEELDIDHIKLENGQIVHDEESKQRAERSQLNLESLDFLARTDYIVLRHIGQKALNLPTSITEQEYLEIEQQRQEARDRIVYE